MKAHRLGAPVEPCFAASVSALKKETEHDSVSTTNSCGGLICFGPGTMHRELFAEASQCSKINSSFLLPGVIIAFTLPPSHYVETGVSDKYTSTSTRLFIVHLADYVFEILPHI